MKTLQKLALLTLLLPAALAVPALAQDERNWVQGVALVGEPKYPDGFAHFDYVNPDAPKGGVVRLEAQGGFDTFNPILPQGETAIGLGLVYESLMTSSMDEVYSDYGLLAEALSFPDDYSSVTFRLDPDARWWDGEPVKPSDVVWTFNNWIAVSPNVAQYYANVESVEVTGEHEVTFTFNETDNRELPKIMGQVIVLPQHWWEGTDDEGNPRDIGSSTLEPPLGSGPYRIESFDPGRTLTYRRFEDYWGADKPVNIGSNNFDEIRYEFFRDTTVAFEAFKGDAFDWWDENIARRWATSYDFPAVQDGRVVLERFENLFRDSGVMVGFVMNLRRAQFEDLRVREAINYAFDFETLRRDIFYGEYNRIDSFFYPTELAASGLPEGEELEILESVRDLVPESVFTTEYTNPVAGTPETLRANLRTALSLLNEAGYTLDGTRLVDENGDQLSFEVLLNGPAVEAVVLAWQTNLETIGINAEIRIVDSPQFINRVRSRDFDMVYLSWRQSLSPGNEQRFMWGSEAAAQDNSSNYASVADPGVDALIDKIIFADDHDTLVAATHALDRVLLAKHFVVPSYAATNSRVARWDRFGRSDELPEYAIGFPTIWWWDEEKAAATGGGASSE